MLHRWSAAGILQALVWIGFIAVGVTLPVLQFALALQFQRGSLVSESRARAFVIGQRVQANPQMWTFETARLEEQLAQDLFADGQADDRLVLDAKGAEVVRRAPPKALAWPVIEHREPLYENGRTAGWVGLQRSLWPQVWIAATVGGISLAGAALMASLVTRLPLSRLRRMEEELAHKAYHDELTGLYNREAFRRLLADGVTLAGRDGRGLAVLYVDLDRFKRVNDAVGPDAGDAVLREAARRLKLATQAGDTVARLSADEFAILTQLPADQGLAAAQALAQRVLSCIEPPFEVADRLWHLGASIGMAQFPEHGRDPDRLLACADTAMLAAKTAGRHACHVYDASLEADAQRRLQTEADLRGALERREFVLHYQPLIDLATGAVRGSEALLRWQHPQRGLVPPIDFIPLLEDSGLIHAVGQWVLEEACRQQRRWQDQGLPMRQVSVNVSPCQFARQNDFVDAGRKALMAASLPARHLQLELTESTLMAEDDQSQPLLAALRQLGVELAIDDFGTGYSSLAYLRRFPVSVLKVDRSFVRDLHDAEGGGASIVRAVVQMARGLHLSVTAEGIETDEQRRDLRAMGCHTGQGFGLGRPMAVPAFEAWLRAWQTDAAHRAGAAAAGSSDAPSAKGVAPVSSGDAPETGSTAGALARQAVAPDSR